MSAPAPRGVHRVKEIVDRLLGGIMAAVMAILVLDVLWQVFTRFVLGDPSSFTDELARYLLIWVGLLGAAFAAGQRLHLAIDLLPERLTGRSRYAMGVLIEAVVLAFALGVLVVGGARLVSLTLLLGQTSAALRVPLGYVYVVLPLSGALMSFYAIVAMLDYLRAFRGDAEARETVPEPVPDATVTTTAYE